MNVIHLIATMSKTDVCLAAIAEIADYASKAARKMPYQELKKRMENLNTFQTPTNVSAAEFAQDFAPVVFGKWKIITKT